MRGPVPLISTDYRQVEQMTLRLNNKKDQNNNKGAWHRETKKTKKTKVKTEKDKDRESQDVTCTMMLH